METGNQATNIFFFSSLQRSSQLDVDVSDPPQFGPGLPPAFHQSRGPQGDASKLPSQKPTPPTGEVQIKLLSFLEQILFCPEKANLPSWVGKKVEQNEVLCTEKIYFFALM